MYNPHIHYRSAFKVEKAGIIAEQSIFQIVVGRLGNWLQTHSQFTDVSASIFRAWFFKGGRIISKGGASAEAQTEKYNEESRSAEKWVLRIEHPDSAYRYRIWRTDIALNCLCERISLLSVTVTRYLRDDYMGEDPPAPGSSIPRFLRELIEDHRIKSTIGNSRLIPQARNLTPADGRELYQAIISKERLLPIVVMNIRDFIGRLSPDGLQNLLLGSGIVYWYDNSDVHQGLEYEWGKGLVEKYQCSPDTIRVYLPSVSTQIASDWKRHRFFLLNEYFGREKELIKIISQSVFRITARNIQENQITDFESLESFRHKERLSKLREAASISNYSSQQNEYLSALEEDNISISAQLKNTQQELSQSQQECDWTELQLQEAQDKIREMQDQFKQFTITEQQYRKTLNLQSDKTEFAKHLPTNLFETLRFIANIFSGNMIILDAAYESAEIAKFQFLPEANELLFSMAKDLHAIFFLQDENDVEAAYKRLGFDLTMKESSLTKANKRLMNLRKRIYNGNEEDFSPHTKLSKNGKDLRVHFFVDHVKKLLVIGHCGDHLETAGTSRRKEG